MSDNDPDTAIPLKCPPVVDQPNNSGAGDKINSKNNNNDNARRNRKPVRNNENSKSKSPVRSDGSNKNRNWNNRSQSKSKSRSPTRPYNNNKGNNNNHHHNHHYAHNQKGKQHGRKKSPKRNSPAVMTVIVNRVDLWDSAAHFQPEEYHFQYHCNIHAGPYYFDAAATATANTPPETQSVAIARVPYDIKFHLPENLPTESVEGFHHCDVIDTSLPNPHDPSIVHDKYWAQRRRLFSRFDRGIQLDSEGWYSVTPEIIADHVAQRVVEIASIPSFPKDPSQGIVLLDAFCGCGGNTIAFGKVASSAISKVVCVDTDRSKLMKAAHNASIYDIPRDKLVFVECNSVFILQHCYKDGEFILDKPTAAFPQHMPPPVMCEIYKGYHIGGLDMLPRHIDAVFMDPPWGGVDYEVLGKNGYDLEKNMKIKIGSTNDDEWEDGGGGVSDDFFDSFTPSQQPMSQKARKANFNQRSEGDFVNGFDLLKAAAEATRLKVVMFDLPRNTNKTSLGRCALAAGYRGNIKLEEHHLNGRLKTVTAYLGADYSPLLENELRNNTPSN